MLDALQVVVARCNGDVSRVMPQYREVFVRCAKASATANDGRVQAFVDLLEEHGQSGAASEVTAGLR